MSLRSLVSPTLGAAALLAAVGAAGRPHPAAAATGETPAMNAVVDYLRNQNSTGFLVIQDGKVLVDRNWPAPTSEPGYRLFVYERNKAGELLEDVASQQKSFVSVLVGVAVDKGMLDVARPVSAYIGTGWSRASPEQEVKIRVIDVLTMSSGLDEKFAYVAEPGTRFFYNTPVYAITKRVVAAAAKQPLETITHDWLTAPVGMVDTAWRKRPAALASVGNDTGLVTTPSDVGRFGEMILHRGVTASGQRILSERSFTAMFTPSATNPAYGRLWWLNGSAYHMRALAGRAEGPLIPAAPADLVGALGAFDRRLYVVPSKRLVVVRTGATAVDKDFDQQLWLRLAKAIG